MRSVDKAIEPLAPGPDLGDSPILQFKEQVGHLRPELSDVIHNILLLEQEDQSLLDHELALDKSFFDLSLQIKRLLNDWAGHPLLHGISSLVPVLLGGRVRRKKEPGTNCLRMRYFILTFQDTGYFLLTTGIQ